MNKKTVYRDAPNDIGEVLLKGEKIDDFLPPPDQLVKRIPKVKITITLNQQSVEFFKKSAKKNKVKYQTMINELLDKYVEKYRDTNWCGIIAISKNKRDLYMQFLSNTDTVHAVKRNLMDEITLTLFWESQFWGKEMMFHPDYNCKSESSFIGVIICDIFPKIIVRAFPLFR